jgi:prepilin-type processing-associated H-X9-DG protein
VELLVVITIIGILIALLLPAVQAAREAARRAQCTNQLKQIGLAALNHESTFRYFPAGGWGGDVVGDPNYGFGINQPGTWLFNILPYIEQQQVHDMCLGLTGSTLSATTDAMQQKVISGLICPSRRAAALYPWYIPNRPINSAGTITSMARTDYAANCGDPLDNQEAYMADPNPISGGTASTYPWPNTSAVYSGVEFARSMIKMADIKDGTSNTYLAGEKYLNPDHYTNGQDDGDDWSLYSGAQNDNVRTCYYASSTSNYAPMQDTSSFTDTERFGSAHAAGCNMVFCDGSVRNISYSIDAQTHAHLGNRKDGQVIDGSKL